MKARLEGGKVVRYNKVPNVLRNSSKTIINASQASDEVLQEFGFYNIVTPERESGQMLTNLHFDNTINAFTYDVVDAPAEEI